jgi:cupin superfamily acireductone dioxygenase involved in methionine salvage
MMLGKQSHFLIMRHFKEQDGWQHAKEKKAGQAKSTEGRD